MAATVAAPPRSRSFEYTATGVLGDKRKSMLSNELHLRSELGKSKGHAHNCMTDPTYVYGQTYPSGDSGVAGALVWKTSEVGIKQVTSNSRRTKKSQKKYDGAYGQPVRPSTPINDVITFKFQNDWIEEQKKLQKAKSDKARSKRVIPGAYRENHTFTLRAAARQPEVDDETLWQMSKFSKHATPKVDTFRDAEPRRVLSCRE